MTFYWECFDCGSLHERSRDVVKVWRLDFLGRPNITQVCARGCLT